MLFSYSDMIWWPFKGEKKGENNSENDSSANKAKQPVFLDDVPPKFQETDLERAKRARKVHDQLKEKDAKDVSVGKQVGTVLHSLTWNDFKPSNLIQIPCFRDAGLSGFSCMFVFSTIMFLYHRDIRTSINWGYGGLLLGSVFGWEHCNRVRRHSEDVVQQAQAKFQEKVKRRSSQEGSGLSGKKD